MQRMDERKKMRNDKPKYQMIIDHIIGIISSGEIKPEQMIPSENQLASEFNISRVTVRKALSILINEGYIFTVQGKGNFVSRPDYNDFIIQVNKSTEEIQYNKKLIEVNIIDPPDDIKIIMQIYDNKKVVVLKRYIINNKKKIAYDIKYLPYNPKEPILEKEFHYINYQISNFTENTSHQLKKIMNIRADTSDETLSQILKTDINYPILILEEKIKNINEQIIGYGITYFLADEFKITGI